MAPPGNAIPVTVLTGFLGSGKTTVLNHLLSDPRLADTAIIINEFGEIGIDHLLVRHAAENLVLLNNGCLCCTVRGDLVRTLGELDARVAEGEIPAFRRLVIETTGLADPAPILHTIMVDPAVAPRWRLEGVIATVDAVNGARTLLTQLEARKQAAVADRILLTKTDLATADQLTELRGRLRALAPATPVINVVDGGVDPDSILEVGLYDAQQKIADVGRWLRDEAAKTNGAHHHDHHHAGIEKPNGAVADVNRHDDQITAHCIVVDEPVSWTAFSYWLDLLAALRGEQMLRVKGIVAVAEHADQPLIIHGVQHIFHPPLRLDAWPSPDHRTRIVFITRGMDSTELARTLRRYGKAEPAAARPVI
jgi:G3E family GTPase